MPNIKSKKKRMKTNAKKNSFNSAFKTSMRTAIKKVETSETKEQAVEALNVANKKLDKALAKGIAHKNYVARQKSRLAKLTNSL